MEAKEELAIRRKMAEMHEEFIEHMCQAYDNHYYIEVVWYCYAIFEQRVNRFISKYIDACTLAPERTDSKTAAISTRIKCLEKVAGADYGPFYLIDSNLLTRVSDWCEKRNELVHGLISLRHYMKYDEEFQKLAKEGVPLVFELYDACTDLREEWYRMDAVTAPFPVRKCQCKKQKCINEKNII